MSRYGQDPIDFGPSDDDYRGFDLQEEETARGPLILALAAGVLIVFAAVVWNTYRQGVRDATGALPVIAAEDGPYKRQPDEAGGTPIPGLDRRIYDELDGSDRSAEDEAPVTADLRGVQDDELVLAGARDGEADMHPAGQPLDLRPGQGPAADDARRPTSSQAIEDEERALAELGGRSEPTAEDVPRMAALNPDMSGLPPARSDAEPAPQRTQEPAMAPAPQFRFDGAGSYLVQIAAFRDEATAERAWRSAVSRKPALYGGASKYVQRADLGARGVFYRLRVGAFSDRQAAGDFCEALKAAGEDCIVVQR